VRTENQYMRMKIERSQNMME